MQKAETEWNTPENSAVPTGSRCANSAVNAAAPASSISSDDRIITLANFTNSTVVGRPMDSRNKIRLLSDNVPLNPSTASAMNTMYPNPPT